MGLFFFFLWFGLGWRSRLDTLWVLIIGSYWFLIVLGLIGHTNSELQVFNSLSTLFNSTNRIGGLIVGVSFALLFYGFKSRLIFILGLICENNQFGFVHDTLELQFYWPARFYNGLFLLHPVLVYLCVCLVAARLLLIASVGGADLIKKANPCFTSERVVFICGCLSLICGSWWAFLLGSFGSLWSDVFVELCQLIFVGNLSLIYFCSFIRRLHLKCLFEGFTVFLWFLNFSGIVNGVDISGLTVAEFDLFGAFGFCIWALVWVCEITFICCWVFGGRCMFYFFLIGLWLWWTSFGFSGKYVTGLSLPYMVLWVICSGLYRFGTVWLVGWVVCLLIIGNNIQNFFFAFGCVCFIYRIVLLGRGFILADFLIFLYGGVFTLFFIQCDCLSASKNLIVLMDLLNNCLVVYTRNYFEMTSFSYVYVGVEYIYRYWGGCFMPYSNRLILACFNCSLINLFLGLVGWGFWNVIVFLLKKTHPLNVVT